MPLNDKVTSLTVAPASTAGLLALAILCWPTQTSGQAVPAPQIGVDSAFNVAPIGAGGAAQGAGPFLEFADSAKRAMKKLTQLYDRGGLEPVTAEERKQLGLLSVSSEALRFRVGMFVEYVTSNMLRLYAMSVCDPQFQQVAQNVQQEQRQLENFQKGRGGGKIYGQMMTDVTTKAGCP